MRSQKQRLEMPFEDDGKGHRPQEHKKPLDNSPTEAQGLDFNVYKKNVDNLLKM